ncbi:422_t:CDS:2 [Racocetra fulgida]|uniref:422_t:CDS:1 n=1 Tax=Racocetra fulgida TaxID=60492 RepID=A0A9N8WHS6_9GLOM|nr:422_t:CDS:2 [Racocetra fulgida]
MGSKEIKISVIPIAVYITRANITGKVIGTIIVIHEKMLGNKTDPPSIANLYLVIERVVNNIIKITINNNDEDVSDSAMLRIASKKFGTLPIFESIEIGYKNTDYIKTNLSNSGTNGAALSPLGSLGSSSIVEKPGKLALYGKKPLENKPSPINWATRRIIRIGQLFCMLKR